MNSEKDGISETIAAVEPGPVLRPDADGDDLSYQILDGPYFGHVNVQDDGVILYTPRRSFVGQDVIKYAVFDQSGFYTTAKIDIFVLPP